MSQNPEVKLARSTELAFTEAHATGLNNAIFVFCWETAECRNSHGSFSCSFSADDSDLRVFLSKGRRRKWFAFFRANFSEMLLFITIPGRCPVNRKIVQ